MNCQVVLCLLYCFSENVLLNIQVPDALPKEFVGNMFRVKFRDVDRNNANFSRQEFGQTLV